MTVSSIRPVNTYSGNNSSQKFDFDFLIEKAEELTVSHINASGTKTLLKFGRDYSIAEVGNPNGSYINFPLEASKYKVLGFDEVISLSLNLEIKQESKFENSSFLNLKVLEWTFDYIIRLIQMLSCLVERSVKVEEGSDIKPEEVFEDIKKLEQNTRNSADFAAQKALESQSKAELAMGYARQAESYSTLRYNVFCVNTGVVDNSLAPAFLVLEGNKLKTSGSFDITTAQGKTYTIVNVLSTAVDALVNGTYNIYINPETQTLKLLKNKLYTGTNFPSDAAVGDFLLNTSKIPYDLEEKSTLGINNNLKDVYAGCLYVSGASKTLKKIEAYNQIYITEKGFFLPQISNYISIGWNGSWTAGAANSIRKSFTAPSVGWVNICFETPASTVGNSCRIYINNRELSVCIRTNKSEVAMTFDWFYPVFKGDVVSITNDLGQGKFGDILISEFYPIKGDKICIIQ